MVEHYTQDVEKKYTASKNGETKKVGVRCRAFYNSVKKLIRQLPCSSTTHGANGKRQSHLTL